MLVEIATGRFLQGIAQGTDHILFVEIAKYLAGIGNMACITAGESGTDDPDGARLIQGFQRHQCQFDGLFQLLPDV